jgi:hypothetical protein
MSKGLGQIQRECLRVIEEHSAVCKRVTTTRIVVEVYRIKARRGVRRYTEAQHTAVKRALAGLRRKGLVKGQQALAQCGDGPIILARRSEKTGRAVRCCYWSIPASPDLDVSNDPGWKQSDSRVAVELSMSVSSVRRGRELAAAKEKQPTA